jgi:hypothetical protein
VPEIGTPGLMSGDGKRGVGHRPQATAPILDSTKADFGHVERRQIKRDLSCHRIADAVPDLIL